MTSPHHPDQWEGCLCGGRVAEYTTENLPTDDDERRDRARELCYGCPKLTWCGQQALENNWSGVVACAVPMPEMARGSSGAMRRARREIGLILEGKASPLPDRLRPRPAPPMGKKPFECAGRCGQILRPRGTTSDHFPRTRPVYSGTRCYACHKEHKRAALELV